MIRLFFSVALIFILSCTDDPAEYEELELKSRDEAVVWVCWNPESKHHGGICTPDCLESGNVHKFCWLLSESDCVDAGLEWQADNCHLLE